MIIQDISSHQKPSFQIQKFTTESSVCNQITEYQLYQKIKDENLKIHPDFEIFSDKALSEN